MYVGGVVMEVWFLLELEMLVQNLQLMKKWDVDVVVVIIWRWRCGWLFGI